MNEPNHEENVYALRISDEKIIHISEVHRKDTGRGLGYFCLGCNRRLQAVLSDIKNRKKFFRHDAEAVKGQPKCTYSDETYRHKLSKEIIQLLGKVRVPNLYKYFMDGQTPRKYLIQESTYIEASKILIENYLFEDKNGKINYSREIDTENGNELFIKPDVIFLDSKGNPILIIELVATHKPKNDKLVKLKRLGINAIQIKIPKDSPESIEKVFFQTTNTVWIYNEQEESFTLPVSGAHSEGISEFDDIQRIFFEENFACRQAQIRNLIRGIERLLESKHYTNTVKDLRSEIQRVERNTEALRKRLDNIRRKFSERGIEQYSERRKELTEKQREFQLYYHDLERRYYAKARELETEESILEQDIAEIEFQEKELNARGASARRTIEEEENAIDRIRRQIEDLPGIYGDIQADFERRIEQAAIEAESIEEHSRRIRSAIDNEPKTLGSKEREIEREIEAENGRIEIEISNFDREIKQLGSKGRTIKETISRQYPTNRGEYIRRIEDGSYQRSKWFNTEHAKLREFTDAIEIYRTLNEELTVLETKNRN